MTPKRTRSAREKFARFIVRFRFLLLVLLTPLLSGCLERLSPGQTPPLPASLSTFCPRLPDPPVPLIDPERATWEADIIGKYGTCAGRHRNAVTAQEQAVNPSKK